MSIKQEVFKLPALYNFYEKIMKKLFSEDNLGKIGLVTMTTSLLLILIIVFINIFNLKPIVRKETMFSCEKLSETPTKVELRCKTSYVK